MSWEDIIKREPLNHNPYVNSIVVDGKRYYYRGDVMTYEQTIAMKAHIRSTNEHLKWIKQGERKFENKQEEE